MRRPPPPPAVKAPRKRKPAVPKDIPVVVPGPPATRLVPQGKVAVRMFCHGLGDCFLVAIREGESDETVRYLAVDCGIIAGNPQGTQRVKEAVRGLRESCGGRLDWLVLTHQHYDHVSSFYDAIEQWEAFTEIGELWFAWTEDLTDELARVLHASRKKAVAVAFQALSRSAAAPSASPASTNEPAPISPPDSYLDADDSLAEGLGQKGIASLMGFIGLDPADAKSMNALAAAKGVNKTQAEMDAAVDLVRGRGGKIVYRRPGEVVTIADGVQFVTLGPPHDERLIKRSDPSKKTAEVYALAASAHALQGFANALEENPAPSTLPFDSVYCIPEAEFEAGKNPVLKPWAELRGHYYEEIHAWRRIDEDWLSAGEFLALDLDGDTNNTSLAFALYLPEDGAALLFPADAQVGNWLSWGDQTYEVAGRGGTTETLTIDGLLARSVFYKVGHHGSHNATMRARGLELMTDPRLRAMVPVDVDVAHNKKGWTEMPFPHLLARLSELTRGRMVQLDATTVPPPFEAGPHSALFGRSFYIDLNPYDASVPEAATPPKRPRKGQA